MRTMGNIRSSADPDRPRLMRGKSTGSGPDVLPSLMGLPPDMHQAVAVSDAKNRPEHPGITRGPTRTTKPR